MRILITGATGMLGSALAAELRAAGHGVLAVTRRPASGNDELQWDPDAGRLDAAAVEGLGGVVHLAGESIGARRWTAGQLERVRESRRRGTALLATTLAGLRHKPRVLVSASAVGYYGDRGNEVLTESSRSGSGFLADVARVWESAARPAAEAGIRVVHPRLGLVLSAAGGALARLLPIARLGLFGPLGTGAQWWSWVTLRDTVRVLIAALVDERLRGPVNVAAPSPVRQRQFARALGRVLGRPAFVPAPGFALRLVLGGGRADELLLASQRLAPEALTAVGFEFADRELEPALRAVLAAA